MEVRKKIKLIEGNPYKFALKKWVDLELASDKKKDIVNHIVNQKNFTISDRGTKRKHLLSDVKIMYHFIAAEKYF